MTKKQLSEEISDALKKLGYVDGARVRVMSAGIDRYDVYVNGRWIGI